MHDPTLLKAIVGGRTCGYEGGRLGLPAVPGRGVGIRRPGHPAGSASTASASTSGPPTTDVADPHRQAHGRGAVSCGALHPKRPDGSHPVTPIIWEQLNRSWWPNFVPGAVAVHGRLDADGVLELPTCRQLPRVGWPVPVHRRVGGAAGPSPVARAPDRRRGPGMTVDDAARGWPSRRTSPGRSAAASATTASPGRSTRRSASCDGPRSASRSAGHEVLGPGVVADQRRGRLLRWCWGRCPRLGDPVRSAPTARPRSGLSLEGPGAGCPQGWAAAAVALAEQPVEAPAVGGDRVRPGGSSSAKPHSWRMPPVPVLGERLAISRRDPCRTGSPWYLFAANNRRCAPDRRAHRHDLERHVVGSPGRPAGRSPRCTGTAPCAGGGTETGPFLRAGLVGPRPGRCRPRWREEPYTTCGTNSPSDLPPQAARGTSAASAPWFLALSRSSSVDPSPAPLVRAELPLVGTGRSG